MVVDLQLNGIFQLATAAAAACVDKLTTINILWLHQKIKNAIHDRVSSWLLWGEGGWGGPGKMRRKINDNPKILLGKNKKRLIWQHLSLMAIHYTTVNLVEDPCLDDILGSERNL